MEFLQIYQTLPPEIQQSLAKDGFEAVKALASCIYRSCGQLLLPWQKERVANAEAKALIIKSKAVASSIRIIGESASEYPNLAIKYTGDLENLNINNNDIKDLEIRANIRSEYQNLKKQKNLESIVGKAYNELIGKKLETKEEVDDDLLTRFFNTAEDISDEQVQTLWARILAGEVLKPRTYSYRFLEVLRNISKNELEIVQKIAPFICEDAIIKDFDNLKLKGILKKDVSILEDMGLLKDTSLQIRGTKIAFGEKHILFHNNEYAFVLYSKASVITTYYIDVLELTETGKQLFSLSEVSLDLEYMEAALSKKIREYPTLSLFASEIIGIEDGQIKVSENHLFEINN